MGLLNKDISELDALDATITEEFLKGEGFEKNMHQSYVKTISVKNKTGHVFYRLYFCERRLFNDNKHWVQEWYKDSGYIFFSPEIYNHGLGKYISLGGVEAFEDYDWKVSPIRTIRDYLEFLEYLKEKAQLF